MWDLDQDLLGQFPWKAATLENHHRKPNGSGFPLLSIGIVKLHSFRCKERTLSFGDITYRRFLLSSIIHPALFYNLILFCSIFNVKINIRSPDIALNQLVHVNYILLFYT